MAEFKVNENSTFRVCRRCNERFLHHFFWVCDKCRKVVEDTNCHLPTEKEIAEYMLEFRNKHIEEMLEKSGGSRTLDDNNVRCYSIVKTGRSGTVLDVRQGVV